MKKIINSLFLIFVFSLILIIDCNAECSYQERKQLLNEAKNVKIDVEIESIKKTEQADTSLEDNASMTYYDYNIKFNVYNVTENLFIKYYNNFDFKEEFISSENLVDGVYIFNVENVDKIMKYKFEIYSLHKNCEGDDITTKTVIKPKLNEFSGYSVCSEDGFSDHKYCKQFITEELNISEGEFYNWVNNVNESSEKNVDAGKLKILDVLFEYWYILVIIIFILILIYIFILINKKRGELK